MRVPRTGRRRIPVVMRVVVARPVRVIMRVAVMTVVMVMVMVMVMPVLMAIAVLVMMIMIVIVMIVAMRVALAMGVAMVMVVAVRMPVMMVVIVAVIAMMRVAMSGNPVIALAGRPARRRTPLDPHLARSAAAHRTHHIASRDLTRIPSPPVTLSRCPPQRGQAPKRSLASAAASQSKHHAVPGVTSITSSAPSASVPAETAAKPKRNAETSTPANAPISSTTDLTLPKPPRRAASSAICTTLSANAISCIKTPAR